jgi:hypothetical protein
MSARVTQIAFTVAAAACVMCFETPAVGAQMAVDSFDGPVTASEIASFRSYVRTLTPASDNIGNNWAQGHSGEQTKAMGLVYEISNDLDVLNQMIRFCDAVLSERNDLAPSPVGQYVIWTGQVDPVWPNNVSSTPIGTGGEQGDPIGHLGNCARQIVTSSGIGDTLVPDGDPFGYGTTYTERALTYLWGADSALDGHVLVSLLDLSRQNRQYFSVASPYMSGHAVPWNQQMMFNYALQNLAACHDLLGDDPNRVARYDAIVRASMDWFLTAGSTSYQDDAGNTAYNWAYAPPSVSGEDSNHGSLDAAGFYRAFISGRYDLTADMMTPFANTLVDVMSIGPRDYAGRVDGTSGTGHAAPTTYIRSGYLLLADFRPDAYRSMMAADLTEGGATGSIDQFSRFLWVKNRRAQ